MRYDELEDAIVQRLQPVATSLGIDILAMPEVQSQFQKPFEKARVTVGYAGSQFNGGRYGTNIPTMSIDSSTQVEDIEVSVHIQARKLRGDIGLYAVMEAVRKRLLYFQPEGLDPLKLVEHKYEDFAENLWSFSAKYATKGVSINDVDTSGTVEPLLKDVDFDDNFVNSQS